MLSSILAGVLAWVILLSVSAYQSMQMHDTWMQNISEQLLGDITQDQNQHIDDLSQTYDIQYQLRYQDEIFTHSHDSQWIDTLPKEQKQGFSYAWHDGQVLRVWSNEEDGLTSYVIQPIQSRVDDLTEVGLGFATILLVLWFMQWLLLRWIIQRQLAPLTKISASIAAKSAQDLTRIVAPDPEIQELQPIVSQLNSMLQRVEQALTAEQRFTADASHELRSPLSAIQMRLQVLQRKHAQNEQLQQDIKVLQADVSRGVQVLENLLLLARLDPEQAQQLDCQNFNLLASIEQVQSSLIWQEKSIHWDVQVASEQQICMNAELWKICLRNLIDNAIRYTPEQGQIRIISQQHNNMLQLLIENTGSGLNDEIMQRLGERFYRVLGTKTQGSGLGLSICQRIMDLHDQQINFEISSLGGLKVVMTLSSHCNDEKSS